MSKSKTSSSPVREYQEPKPYASVGWRFPRKPDFVVTHNHKLVVFFGTEAYDANAIAEDITYEEYNNSKEVFK